jgi:hypothetical protein
MKKILVLALLASGNLFAQRTEAQPQSNQVIEYDNYTTEKHFLYANGCDSVFEIVTRHTVLEKHACIEPKALEVYIPVPEPEIVPEEPIVCVLDAPKAINFWEDNCESAPAGTWEIVFLYSRDANKTSKYKYRVEAESCGYRYILDQVFSNYCKAAKKLSDIQKVYSDAYIRIKVN